ncbi:2-hydroxychromene-2-carboxylate isomerase [Caldimonas brevitalea]|uniref:2-hydroxychromene-2-carboxylate isomerase n=1 Tax=Caldimonas brevitalea TaxID=413882 RepID=A0A0G3BU81_9BURK|nr:DsbA family protein [Caldimonas brevitalea]AKJ30090.1 isomerase [Caldimonas brevitalea]
MSRRPRFYFSFRSPYSWLAYHDLRTEHPQVLRELEWRPFWEPDVQSERMLTELGGRFIYAPMSKEKHLYLLRDVRRLAQRRGLTITWPLDDAPWWEVAHLAYFAAVDAGQGPAFVERVYRARWQEGRNISDPDTIAELAESVGVPGDAARSAVDRTEMRERGAQALLAIDRDGVFGVPFFIDRSQRFWGIDRLNDFLASLGGNTTSGAALLTDASPASATHDRRTADHGHAGGCG